MDLFTFIAVIVVGTPIAKAVANRISSQSVSGGAEMRHLLEHTEQRLLDTEQALADSNERLTDLEERLDVAERLLARHNAKDQLGP